MKLNFHLVSKARVNLSARTKYMWIQASWIFP